MDEERRKKLEGRLKKCLALSKSPEPHEAAAALRQAQALMRELGITEDDLDMADAVVKTREGFGRCRTMSALSNMLEDAFSVKAVFEANPGSANRLNVRYIGPRAKVMLAEYAHRVVWRAMQAAWDEVLVTRPWMKSDGGKRQSFHMGWLRSVREKIEAIAPTEAEEKAIKRYCDRLYRGGLVTQDAHKRKQLDASAYLAGGGRGRGLQPAPPRRGAADGAGA